ncbi:hypothetical protein [Mycobacterium leprae]|uniref:hypothetical protein n=1 Tax=Mycobacterium leprae TaxID=1769 RepID=UPI00195503CF|nr:hypothetical protein [Mycobacterium leprae]
MLVWFGWWCCGGLVGCGWLMLGRARSFQRNDASPGNETARFSVVPTHAPAPRGQARLPWTRKNKKEPGPFFWGAGLFFFVNS